MTTVQERFLPAIDRERCKGCALCVSFCPAAVLAMSETTNRRGYRVAVCRTPEACTGCLQCAEICPDAAIEIRRRNSK